MKACFLVCFLFFSVPNANAGWVFVPDNLMTDPITGKVGKVRIYNAGLKMDVFFTAPVINAVTGVATPQADVVLDPLTNALVPLTQTNIVNYGITQPSAFLNAGSIIAGINEAAIAQTFTTTAPWILWAYLSGWLVAMPLALMLNFLRGRVNSSV